ncbi:hypothetical protein [Comamonas sp. GB3 AK4-5]|uniref:hypothetical protein n=1 Tax=Comamonas sp. GB3 AK4-5 TaxID=3231487 RepID=UPI00351E3C17
MSSSISPPISSLSRGALALALGVFLAAASAIFIFFFQPDFFGSGFEGSSGYMAMFVYTPLVALALAPICWVLLRRAGPLTVLLQWFVLVFLIGWFIGLVGWVLCGWLAWRMARLWREQTQQGLSVRALWVSSGHD